MSVLERIQLLRNIGQFDSVNAGAQLPLSKLTMLYAENGRGKTTLAAILRSLSTGDPRFILERHRLSATNKPHVVLQSNGTSFVFENDAWSANYPNLAIFDDVFVAENVCSGIDVQTEHRQNLHELILGSQGALYRRMRPGSRSIIVSFGRGPTRSPELRAAPSMLTYSAL